MGRRGRGSHRGGGRGGGRGSNGAEKQYLQTEGAQKRHFHEDFDEQSHHGRGGSDVTTYGGQGPGAPKRGRQDYHKADTHGKQQYTSKHGQGQNPHWKKRHEDAFPEPPVTHYNQLTVTNILAVDFNRFLTLPERKQFGCEVLNPVEFQKSGCLMVNVTIQGPTMEMVMATTSLLRETALNGPVVLSAAGKASDKFGVSFVFRKVSADDIEILLWLRPGSTRWSVPNGLLDEEDDLNYEGIVGLKRIVRETADPALKPHDLVALRFANALKGRQKRICRAFVLNAESLGERASSWPASSDSQRQKTSVSGGSTAFTINGRTSLVTGGLCWINAADLLIECPDNLDPIVQEWYIRNADHVLRELSDGAITVLPGQGQVLDICPSHSLLEIRPIEET